MATTSPLVGFLQEILLHPEQEQQILARAGNYRMELERRLKELRDLSLLTSIGHSLRPGRLSDRLSYASLRPGEKLLDGRFEVTRKIGGGGQGVVFEAHDLVLGRHVAIKIAHAAEDSELAAKQGELQRFVQEAQLTGYLEHPNIVTAHELGLASDGHVYLIMNLVAGQSIADLVASETTIPLTTRLRWLIGVCDALQYAHDNGVVHRDLKPANVMIGAFGEVQVVDWGCAKRFDPEAQDQDQHDAQSDPSWVMGTPAFMSPEQARGQDSLVGIPTDVFALGGLLAFLLNGEPLFLAEDEEGTPESRLRATLKLAQTSRFTNPLLLGSKTPQRPELVSILKSCCAPQIVDRYDSPAEVKEDLLAVLEYRGGIAWKTGPVQRTLNLARRYPARTVLIAGLIASLFLLVSLQRIQRSAAMTDRLVRLLDLANHLEEAMTLSIRDIPILYDGGVADLRYLTDPQSKVQAEPGPQHDPEEAEIHAWTFTRDRLLRAFEEVIGRDNARPYDLSQVGAGEALVRDLEALGRQSIELESTILESTYELHYAIEALAWHAHDPPLALKANVEALLRGIASILATKQVAEGSGNPLPPATDSRLLARYQNFEAWRGEAFGLRDATSGYRALPTGGNAGSCLEVQTLSTGQGRTMIPLLDPGLTIGPEPFSMEDQLNIRFTLRAFVGGWKHGHGIRPLLRMGDRWFAYESGTTAGVAPSWMPKDLGSWPIGDFREFDPQDILVQMDAAKLDALLAGGPKLRGLPVIGQLNPGLLMTNSKSGPIRYRYDNIEFRLIPQVEANSER